MHNRRGPAMTVTPWSREGVNSRRQQSNRVSAPSPRCRAFPPSSSRSIAARFFSSAAALCVAACLLVRAHESEEDVRRNDHLRRRCVRPFCAGLTRQGTPRAKILWSRTDGPHRNGARISRRNSSEQLGTARNPRNTVEYDRTSERLRKSAAHQSDRFGRPRDSSRCAPKT